ncbi:MAG: urea amidolyase family protein [Castellaniella sp.]|uniref:5-oxoprolinase subunit B/C family protein n=1 Tax=Castellaniella sp. TaxID=1955812 RepID=UPI003C71C0A1
MSAQGRPKREFGLRCLPAGDSAVLAELGSLDETLALFQALVGAWPAGVEDVIPAARTLLVLFSPTVLSARDVTAWLQRVAATQTQAGPSGPRGGAGQTAAVRRVEIPVRYAGEDLEAVASLIRMTRAELIERHTGSDYLAAFAGFAPGFVYLAGGDPCFHGVPRHAMPRVRVPGGSVAVAGDFSAVYPSDSPGGWQLLGETPWRMWDMERAEPALVQPGFRVRFRDLDAPGVTVSLPAAKTNPPAPPVADVAASVAAAACEVLDAGLQTLIQDAGRPGLTRLGVSRSGALDRQSMHRANQLVGNPSDSPVLEHALGGLRLLCRGRAVMAVTGATAPVVVTSASGIRLPAAAGHPIVLNEGDELRIGRVRAGVRCYVAVQGAWAVPAVLGSCATDVLAGMGPAPLKRGDRVLIGPPMAPGADSAAPAFGATEVSRAEDRVTFDVVLGPRDDWFDADTVHRLVSQDWVVTPQSNRVGMRLAGDKPLVRARQGELPSEGTVAGALQVPPSGQPVLFLADHPLTGGYPVIAVVLSTQLDRLAQMPVGARLRFRPVTDPLPSPASGTELQRPCLSRSD